MDIATYMQSKGQIHSNHLTPCFVVCKRITLASNTLTEIDGIELGDIYHKH